jgi:pimeloyl-ACP methyl ester carboxylesterase
MFRATIIGWWLAMGLSMTINPLHAEAVAHPYQAGTTRSFDETLIHHRFYPRLHQNGHRTPTPTLVLIHGWSCDASYWDAQLGELLPRYSVLTIDLAGHGQSASQRDDFTMSAFGTDVARAVMQAVPEGSVILIGHSMGGPVAIEAARQLGSRVRAIFGVDTFKNIGGPPPDPAQTEARLQFFADDFVGTTTNFVTQTFFRDDADPALKARIAADMAASDPRVGISAIRGLNDWDGVIALDALRAVHSEPLPILAVNSRHGSPTDLARLQQIYPAFGLREMDGVGHFLMMEQPGEFNTLLIEELVRLAP